MLALINPAQAEEEQKFKNPLFYQQLIDVMDDSMYLLTPTTKFFDALVPEQYIKVECKLLKNEENFIELLCNDCTNLICDKHQKRINTFEILPNDEKSEKYYIRHRVFDESKDSMLRENLLWSDGLISVIPTI